MDTTEDITNVVRLFSRHLVQQGIPVTRAILFGSWAKGTATPDSDIDVGIVSPRFGDDDLEEMQLLLLKTRDIDDRIEPIPLSIEDYETDATPFIMEIKKYGKLIDVASAS